MDVTAMSKMAYAMNQSAAKLPQAERVQTAQAAKGGAADAAKTAQDAGAAFDVKISDAAKKKAADAKAAETDEPAKGGKTKGLTADEGRRMAWAS